MSKVSSGCRRSHYHINHKTSNTLAGLALPQTVTDLQLWCAKNAIYIQLWPLGTIKVEKYVN